MREVSHDFGLQYLHRILQGPTNVSPLQGASNDLAKQGRDIDRSTKIFALDGKQDSATITTWIEFLLPELPAILDPSIGQDYSASLVRQGVSEIRARPRIRIQSPYIPGSASRKNIKQAINDICLSNMRACIPAFFCRGYLKLLASPGGISEESSEESSSIDDEEEGEHDPTFHYKKYWENPGMGASIGLRCSSRVSATLGGYLLVDENKLLLTVNHFIEHSHRETFPSSMKSVTLTSPSLSDVNEIRSKLGFTSRTLLDECKRLTINLGGTEIPLTGEPPPETERIKRGLEVVEKSQSDLERPVEDFILGDLVGHCQLPDIELPIDAESSSSGSANKCRMDWAMFSVETRRMGENRHRFQPWSGFEFDETISDVDTGNFCNDTCDISKVEPNTSAYYIGQRSGPRKGCINAVPMLLKDKGIITHEYTLICQEGIPISECCEGDSGAWILTETGNKFIGLLWGWNDGQLVFTPSKPLFADIKKVFRAVDVRLPHDPIKREPPQMAFSGEAVVPQTVLTCANNKGKNTKPYSLSTLVGRKPKSLRSKSRAKASIENEAVANQGTSPASETRDIAAPKGRKNLPPSSYDSSSSDPSLKLDIPYPVNDSSLTRIADTSSIGRSSAEKQPQLKCKMFKGFRHSQDRKVPMTDPDKDLVMHEQNQLPKAGPAGLDDILHPNSQSPLWYISLSVLANHLTFPSKSQAIKTKYKFGGFLFSQMDEAAQPKYHDLRS